jgi:hypothetical protein
MLLMYQDENDHESLGEINSGWRSRGPNRFGIISNESPHIIMFSWHLFGSMITSKCDYNGLSIDFVYINSWVFDAEELRKIQESFRSITQGIPRLKKKTSAMAHPRGDNLRGVWCPEFCEILNFFIFYVKLYFLYFKIILIYSYQK